MNNSDENRIKALAYQIWEAEGRPYGQDERHWQMAQKLVEAESQTETSAAAEPAKRKPRAPRAKQVVDESAPSTRATTPRPRKK